MILFFPSIFFWLLWQTTGIPLRDVRAYNQRVTDAETQFVQGNYEEALLHYQYLQNAYPYRDAYVQLNAAHSYFRTRKFAAAQSRYTALATSKNASLRSVACLQLGVLAYRSQQWGVARQFFRQALLANPSNEQARYNYELAAKLHPGDEGLPPPDDTFFPPNDQPPPSGDSQGSQPAGATGSPPSSGAETDKSGQAAEARQQLQKMQISEEKARAILDAMKNNEIQYIQQRKRTSGSKPDPGQPDW